MLDHAYKLAIHHVAAQFTAAVAANFVDDLPADPTLSDPKMTKDMQAVWEMQKTFVQAVSRSLDDPTWQFPAADPASAAKFIDTVLGQVVSGGGPLAAIIQQLIAKFLGGGSAPAPVTPAAPVVLK